MSKKSNQRLIIVIWRWTEGKDFNSENEGYWETQYGDRLIRLDASGRAPNWLEQLIEVLGDHGVHREVLLLLHSTEPHDYTKNHAVQLLDKAPDSLSSLRIRFFGGGEGPIYFSANFPLGVLGRKGNWPDKLLIFSPEYKKIEPNLILDFEKRLINIEHFNFVWQTYWFPASQLLRELTEYFWLWGSGYGDHPEHADLPLVNYLQQEAELWKRLVGFAGLKGSEASGEYNFQDYEARLRDNEPAAHAELTAARQLIRKEIEKCREKTGQERHTIELIYNTLLNLFKNIASID